MSDIKIDSFRGNHFFLSNFYPCEVEYEGVVYPSSEHAYQAAKSLDPDVREFVRKCATPGKSKELGKEIDLRPNWGAIKIQVMEDILRIKFSDPTLQALLINTGDAELIEGNWWKDIFWGVWNDIGSNNLGKLLMKIREDIKNGSN